MGLDGLGQYCTVSQQIHYRGVERIGQSPVRVMELNRFEPDPFQD